MKLLTLGYRIAILFLLSQKTKDGIGVLNDAAQPQICGFFVPNAQLSIMAGWVEQPKGWPVASPVRQLHSVRLPMIGVVRRRVYNLFSGDAIMKNKPAHGDYAQNPLTALFSIYHVRKLIASNVPGSLAIHLKQYNPEFIVKFDRMEVAR